MGVNGAKLVAMPDGDGYAIVRDLATPEKLPVENRADRGASRSADVKPPMTVPRAAIQALNVLASINEPDHGGPPIRKKASVSKPF
jgi:hypothetical protein